MSEEAAVPARVSGGEPPARVRVVIAGAGFAGLATAAALARRRVGPGLVLEREPIPGAHASGKNAAIARQLEFDPIVRVLAVASLQRIRERRIEGRAIVDARGGLYLGRETDRPGLAATIDAMRSLGVEAWLWSREETLARFPYLEGAAFDCAAFSPTDGVIDIHALLAAYLDEARAGGWTLLTRTLVEAVEPVGGRGMLVRTSRGDVEADAVVDATGAWAGRLGRGARPLPLQPVRRHLFISGPSDLVPAGAPLVWDLAAGYYLRPESGGLLLSPCDESPHPPAAPDTDPAALDLLAAKLTSALPALADLPIRSGWACLRTFAPDRRPVIGPDPVRPGLFHVAGLGGFGVGTSWAVGELAADAIEGRARSDEVARASSPTREALVAIAPSR